jgi:NADH-quinone oxidoreductase subunit D
MKEKLNEDGSELSIPNLGPTHPCYATEFSKCFVDGWGTYFRSEPTIGYIHALLKNCRKRPFTKSHLLQT